MHLPPRSHYFFSEHEQFRDALRVFVAREISPFVNQWEEEGSPPLIMAGSEALKQELVVPVLEGRKIAALAITEPGGGSDVAAVGTAAISGGAEEVMKDLAARQLGW